MGYIQKLTKLFRHGHDGTTEVKLYLNGNLFCNSIQYYGLRPGWIQPHNLAVQHGDVHAASMQYISDAVACEDYGRLEKGDRLWTEAFYNATKYPQMVSRGRLQGVSAKIYPKPSQHIPLFTKKLEAYYIY